MQRNEKQPSVKVTSVRIQWACANNSVSKAGSKNASGETVAKPQARLRKQHYSQYSGTIARKLKQIQKFLLQSTRSVCKSALQ
jgi:hypothetical protein